MRRCLHACLIGVLSLSLSMDAARACWFLSHGCHGSRPVVIACPPVVVAREGDAWEDPCAEACGVQDVFEVVVDDSITAEATDCQCDCGATAFADDQTAVTAIVDAESAGVSVATEPTLAEAEPPRAADAQAAASASVVPRAAASEEVRQAVALTEPETPAAEVLLPREPKAAQEPEAVATPPMEEDVPDVESAPVTAAEPVPPSEPNIFDEVDQAAADRDGVSPMPEPAAAVEPQSVPESTPEDEGAPQAPADPFDAARRPPREPARRWIDRSGGYAVVGSLRDVRDDGTCVLETPERIVEVPLESLSRFDQSYVQAAAARLVAAQRGPNPGDTAGR